MQTQSKYNFFTQVQMKRIYRFCILREYLLTVNTSGLYRISGIQNCAKATGIAYNTLRADISIFTGMGLLIKGNGYLKLNSLTRQYSRLYTLFKLHRLEIESQGNPALYFADIYKKKIIVGNIIAQSLKEAERIKDKKLVSKYLKYVRHGKTGIGVKQCIYLSLGTIGKIFGRCKATAFKYIERMNSAELLKRIKEVSAALCPAYRINELRKAENLYGRLFIENGYVFQRLQNSYQFNF